MKKIIVPLFLTTIVGCATQSANINQQVERNDPQTVAIKAKMEFMQRHGGDSAFWMR